MRSAWTLLLAVSAAACSTTVGEPSPPLELRECEPAFRAWVDIAERLNQPDADLVDMIQRGERQQVAVFELCTLAEAERLNIQVPVQYVPGAPEPMIKPDFRTFAEVECVDESPLLDGTALCAEVGR